MSRWPSLSCAGWRACCAKQVEQVCLLGLIEVEGVRDAVDHALGDTDGVAALETDVVLRGDADEQGRLFATQSGYAAPISSVRG